MITGARSLVETAHRAGVEVCFANPGTTEIPIVMALEEAPGVRAVLCLFEGVCTGAADGWARMTGRPAATLLHLGPGLSNGLANLHNARRGRTPVVNWIGEHATYHRAFDPPLAADITSLTDTVGWTRTVASPQDMAEASLAAVQAALGPPGQVASLIIPADCQWSPGPAALQVGPPSIEFRSVESGAVQEAVRLLRMGGGGMLLGGNALTERGLRAAARVATATGCGVWIETFPARYECGHHVPSFSHLPYLPEPAREALADVSCLVLAGAGDPVAFFGYPDQPSRFVPDGAVVHSLADPNTGVDAALALEALAQELQAADSIESRWLPDKQAFTPKGQLLNPDTLGRSMAALVPDDAIVVNEAGTVGFSWKALAANAAPHTALGITGGAIGQGLPTALGAALACPDQRVIAFEADGSGLYTLQALWSMARESANVTVVICANRRYQIIQLELSRAAAKPGPKALALTDLAHPAIDWVHLAKGFGLPAYRVQTSSEFSAAFTRTLSEPGPSLIEAVLA